jgi:hypothetical protein
MVSVGFSFLSNRSTKLVAAASYKINQSMKPTTTNNSQIIAQKPQIQIQHTFVTFGAPFTSVFIFAPIEPLVSNSTMTSNGKPVAELSRGLPSKTLTRHERRTKNKCEHDKSNKNSETASKNE